ncbi:MAG: tRNA uridine-5-carboxymethylaminomethyl(34) synthesis GTPase MnmE [Clostridiales bacterium]|nr:tRNA uridine-5-carboxymethylaminomethyl(34) synthesis GTPase MnmE [Clostridiales bacterium]
MNNINRNADIIVALATPYGKSAVAIIRVSGNGCEELVNKFLARRLSVGKIKVNNFRTEKFTENLMAVLYKSPHSYTGEDVVELFPHGNMTICDGIIKTLVESGARIAERGEFTKRAFLNGKVDLMQSEALADIIDAQTAEQLDYGNKRFDGGFKSLENVEKLLLAALSSIEAVLHYSDELEENEIDDVLLNDVNGAIESSMSEIKKEIDGFVGGKILKDGFKIALIGAPNVGKSTLLNALLGNERAIVTPIAGTTRDTVDGDFIYNDRKFTVTDTAGLNEKTSDVVEKIGIDRAIKAASEANVVVCVTEFGKKEKISLPEDIENAIFIENKCDSVFDVGTDYEKAKKDGKLQISAKNGINITALKQLLYDLCPKDHGAICNHRQYDCAVRCFDSLVAAKVESKRAEGFEIVAALLYEAYSAITDLHGEAADEKVISAVFERFCVGK